MTSFFNTKTTNNHLKLTNFSRIIRILKSISAAEKKPTKATSNIQKERCSINSGLKQEHWQHLLDVD